MDSSHLPVDQYTTCAEGLEADSIPAHGISEREESTTASPPPETEDLDCYSMMEPPPLDWRSDSSSEAGSPEDLVDSTLPQSACSLGIEDLGESGCQPMDAGRRMTPFDPKTDFFLGNTAGSVQNIEVKVEKELKEEVAAEVVEDQEEMTYRDTEKKVDNDKTHVLSRRPDDEDHSHIHTLLSHLQLREKESHTSHQSSFQPEPGARSSFRRREDSAESKGLLFSESHHTDLLGLLQCTEINAESRSVYRSHRGEVDAVVSVSYSQEDAQRFWGLHGSSQHPQHRDDSISPLSDYNYPEPVWKKMGEEPPQDEVEAESKQSSDDRPSYKDVPGPCDPEDLLDGVIFGAKYLGSTQIKSDRNPSTNARMAQAHEAVDRIKAPEGESQPMTEVDLFISTQRIKVLTADTQEAMMDHALQMISYIADISNIVVLMARRKQKGHEGDSASTGSQKKCTMICHVFSSEDAQIIAQAIGQAFGVAYQQFLQASGIKASDLRPGEYSDYLETQELYNGDLAHFSDSQNLRDVVITKAPGEILGLAVVESGWGSILPTVVVANLLHGGPAERCSELSIGDRIMSVNGTSLVGLPITTCQNIIRDLKSQKYVKLSIVHCPPVTMAIIRRPDPKFQLGFSVEDGIICSLMRGGIAERGGIRVGHRIIEINGQSVVATPHEKIIQTLTNAVGEIHLKTMPASTYRLLTGQEQPVFL
uniref:Amyloid-beta A4 precursor protein-binding family A member 3 n=1 Tax=Oryzias latipes TaxID=8090 RepID=A0A3P9J8N3_ORYLA